MTAQRYPKISLGHLRKLFVNDFGVPLAYLYITDNLKDSQSLSATKRFLGKLRIPTRVDYLPLSEFSNISSSDQRQIAQEYKKIFRDFLHYHSVCVQDSVGFEELYRWGYLAFGNLAEFLQPKPTKTALCQAGFEVD